MHKQIRNKRDRGSQSGCLRGTRRHHPAGSRGFTLLEVQIAVTLLALIVLIIAGAMRLSLRSVSGGEKRMDAQERLRTSLAVMDAQIQSQIPLTYEEEGNKKFYFRGDGKSLRFSTNYSIWGGQKGYVIVDYWIVGSGEGRESLYAGERIPGLSGRRNTRLLDASEISFEYLFRNALEEQGQWMEVFSEGDAIPGKVKVLMRDGAKTVAWVFPVRVGGEITPILGGTATPAKP